MTKKLAAFCYRNKVFVSVPNEWKEMKSQGKKWILTREDNTFNKTSPAFYSVEGAKFYVDNA